MSRLRSPPPLGPARAGLFPCRDEDGTQLEDPRTPRRIQVVVRDSRSHMPTAIGDSMLPRECSQLGLGVRGQMRRLNSPLPPNAKLIHVDRQGLPSTIASPAHRSSWVDPTGPRRNARGDAFRSRDTTDGVRDRRGRVRNWRPAPTVRGGVRRRGLRCSRRRRLSRGGAPLRTRLTGNVPQLRGGGVPRRVQRECRVQRSRLPRLHGSHWIVRRRNSLCPRSVAWLRRQRV